MIPLNALGIGGGELTGIAKEFTAHTNRQAATSGRTRGTGSQSTGGGTPGTRLRYRTCSTHCRRFKTSGRHCGATSRRVGSGCGGRSRRGFSLSGLAIQDGGLVIGKGAHTGNSRQRAHKLTVGQSRRLSRFRIQPPSDLPLLLNSHGANNTRAVSSQGSNL